MLSKPQADIPARMNERPLSAVRSLPLSDCDWREPERAILAEAVWKVGDLVVSGVEPEVADGWLCRGCRAGLGDALS